MREVEKYTFHCSFKRDWNQWVLIFLNLMINFELNNLIYIGYKL